jgi:hypothetical protein
VSLPRSGYGRFLRAGNRDLSCSTALRIGDSSVSAADSVSGAPAARSVLTRVPEAPCPKSDQQMYPVSRETKGLARAIHDGDRDRCLVLRPCQYTFPGS